ncbi:hypothetical protein CSUI_008726, partial [Cystoisospora suis]
MTHLVVACGDFTRLTLEQLQARAEAFALGEHLQERKNNQGTPTPPASILAAKELKSDLGNQCFECGANDHWAKDCPHRLRKLEPRPRYGEPRVECRICRKRGHDAQVCWFKGMSRCKRCQGFGHQEQVCHLATRGVRGSIRPNKEPSTGSERRRADKRRSSRSPSRTLSRSRSRERHSR